MAKEDLEEGIRGKVFAVASKTSATFEQFITETNIDFIIAKDQNSESLFDVLEGSRIGKMIQKADVPLMVVDHCEDFALRNIMIATDLSREIPFTSLKICQFFQNHGAKLHFVNVITTDLITESEVVEKIKQLATNAGIEDFETYITHHPSESEGLNEAKDKILPDLLLMKTYQKSGIWRLAFGSLMEKITGEWDVPVLVEKVDDNY